MKKIGIKSRKNIIKTTKTKTETDARFVRNKSLAVKRDVPGKPIVTSTAKRLTSQSRGVELAIPDMKT